MVVPHDKSIIVVSVSFPEEEIDEMDELVRFSAFRDVDKGRWILFPVLDMMQRR